MQIINITPYNMDLPIIASMLLLALVLHLVFADRTSPLQTAQASVASKHPFNFANDPDCSSNTSAKFKGYGKETHEKPRLGATLGAGCSAYTDCYNCSVDVHCHWCSLKDCGGHCRSSGGYSEWYKKLSLCDPSEHETMRAICPQQATDVADSHNQVIAIPPKGRAMPKNGFCFWELHNDDEYDVAIDITNYEVPFLAIHRMRTVSSLRSTAKLTSLTPTTASKLRRK